MYRQRKGGGNARFQHSELGAPQNGDGRTCMRQAEPHEILCICYAMRVSDFFFFLPVYILQGLPDS